MQSIESYFEVYDNTPAKSVKIISINKGKKKFLSLGDIVTVIPKNFRRSKEMQKKKKYLGLIIGLKTRSNRKNGLTITSLNNKVLMLTQQKKFMGTRVYGGICKEAKLNLPEENYMKIYYYASGVF